MSRLVLISGRSSGALSVAVASKLGTRLSALTLERFPDGELHVELGESVRGADVFVVQSLSQPVDAHLLELLLVGDAARRAGARRLTAVVPYLAYARQDRRARGREPVAARLVADLIATAGFQRVVAIDLHQPALEGMFSVELEHLSAAERLEAQLGPLAEDSVIVAPDLGAAKLAERLASRLERPAALVHKTRHAADRVSVRRISGQTRGLRPIIVDDMISTGGTLIAAGRALQESGATPPFTVVATHGVFSKDALARLSTLPIDRVIVTNTIAHDSLPGFVHVVDVTPLLATAIHRLHRDESIDDLLAHV